jgi:hypothetical protein
MTGSLDLHDPVTVTPLKTGQRADWHVASTPDTSGLPVPFVETDIVAQLRIFFDRLEAEADQRRDDPVAMVNVLARMEALLADVRSVTSMIRKYTAEALSDNGIRRITIDDVATMEGTSDSERTDWQHVPLLTAMLKASGWEQVNADTGEIFTYELAETILEWFRVEWRLTPIRALGLDPDDYSTQPKDEDGKPLRTPTVRIHDNTFRKQQVV